jgi:uncharacterized membrane protein YdbT with pleckstrin-like domain
MGYVEKVLQPEETVTYKTTVHWFLYIPAMAWTVIAIAFAVLWSREATGSIVMGWASVVCLGLGAVAWIYAWIQRITTELAVTSRRVIYKSGLLRRHTLEMNLSKVESVGVTQSVLGRIFSYGKVELKGTGASTSPLPMIADPLRFRSHITAG